MTQAATHEEGSSSSSSSATTSATPNLRTLQAVPENDCEEAFVNFQQQFRKRYASLDERKIRYAAFCANYEIIKKTNAEGRRFTLGLNEFADLAPEEFKARYGLSPEVKSMNLSAIWGGAPELEFMPLKASPFGLPSSVDWRNQKAVTGVQSQGECGACWTFATAGAIEGAWKIAGGPLRAVSEQQFLDCANGAWGNEGCKGGAPALAFIYAHQNDICTANSYRYLARESGQCGAGSCSVAVPKGGIRGYRAVPANDEQALLTAVAQQPVAVSVDADTSFFQLYDGGIIQQDCGSKIDHGILLVGYGTDNGQDYWLIKNSWGPTWGENGFGRIARGVSGSGECGILTQSAYPVIDPNKVVPGSDDFDLDPGTWASIALAALCLCIFLFCVRPHLTCSCCRRRFGRREAPLLTSVSTTSQPARGWFSNPFRQQPLPQQQVLRTGQPAQVMAPQFALRNQQAFQVAGQAQAVPSVTGNSRESRLVPH